MVRGIKPPGKDANAKAPSGVKETKPAEGHIPGHRPSKFYEDYKKEHGALLAAMGKVD